MTRLDSPDETRPFADKGQAAVVNIGGGTVLRGTFEPGWRWSEHYDERAASLLNERILAFLEGEE